MRVRIGYTTQEDFLARLVLQTEDGLTLGTIGLIWKSNDELRELFSKFFAFAEQIGAENLPEMRAEIENLAFG